MQDKIIKDIQDFTDDLSVNISTSLEKDLRLDSMGVIELILMLEDKYDVEFEESTIESIHTVEEIVKYISSYDRSKI